MKDAGMRIRVEEDLRRQFINACKKNDVSAAQVIRGFMRNFVDRHDIGDQSFLFPQHENGKTND
ncbi:hypothetical protein CSQ92_18440 [Janthinobacterium sp. BJB446]|uniref:hypothetical protein n=1 Tax=Janthinobacterium sp. BJB446 TaxID=2048009 RepID=UPI000C10FA23|nr:hypothetical protein [Janthinobacterium sp. BJB446]PHV21329.1 hypothetical protein CSQ92_18440 [Janthinobacterium sp. BJB446]